MLADRRIQRRKPFGGLAAQAPYPRPPDRRDARRVVLAEPIRVISNVRSRLATSTSLQLRCGSAPSREYTCPHALAEVLLPVPDRPIPLVKSELDVLNRYRWTQFRRTSWPLRCE